MARSLAVMKSQMSDFECIMMAEPVRQAVRVCIGSSAA